jgi:starch phosphorylase
VAPPFYNRNTDGVPERWVADIRSTLAGLSPELNAGRMVREYVEKLYRPAGASEARLSANNYRGARELAAWKARIVGAWPGVAVEHVESGGVAPVPQVGDELRLRAHVQLNGLAPEDVTVQVVYGKSVGDDLSDVSTQALEAIDDTLGQDATAVVVDGAPTLFTGTVELNRAGGFGYTVRVVPRNDLLASSAEMGLVAVAS